MASTVTIVRGEVPEGTAPVFRRVLSNDAGVMLVQADVSVIDLKVYQGNDKTAIYTAPALTFTPSANMFNTAQTDGWTIGGTGYDFKAVSPAAVTALMDGGENYRFEFLFTLTAGGNASAIFIVQCVPLTSQ